MADGALAARQRAFYALIADARPVSARFDAREPHAVEAARALSSSTGLSVARRLEIYQTMRFFRLHDSLREDFPFLPLLLGDGAFTELVHDYLRTHPSRSHTLRDLGWAMPAFLRARHACSVGCVRPELAELCALNLARMQVFDAKDPSPLDERTLQTRVADGGGALWLRLIAAHSFVASSHLIDAVWLALDRDAPLPPPRALPEQLLVWKRDYEVRHRQVDSAELRLLCALALGMSFGELCERLAMLTAADTTRPAAERVFTTLRQWLTDGLLELSEPPDSTPALPL